jgi:hypothetical protein
MAESLTTSLDEIEIDAEAESPPRAPRWVKAFGIALVVLLLVFVAMHLSGHAPMAGIHGA